MKYGETLQQRSIPAWSHYNIDYDDIKHFIKERTTPGHGKTVALPGTTDDKLGEFENSLFHILVNQHQRIDLFVRSKVGEIQRRLDHAKKRLRRLSAQYSLASDERIPVARLERYGRLENDILKAGDEIRSLARFTSTQRTAFRKLLKKYKKWTGSTHLEDRFRDEVLDDPKSFTQLDLGPLLDEYSSTLQQIQSLWDRRRQQFKSEQPGHSPYVGTAIIARLQSSIDSGSKVEFDNAIATVPLGQHGMFASYLVHPENVVELQMLLLQHARYYSARSRSNSVNAPVSTSPHEERSPGEGFDYFALTADDPQRFATELNALTIDDRERMRGLTPQRTRYCARWSWDEDALVYLRFSNGSIRRGTVRKKHITSFLDSRAAVDSSKYDEAAAEIRRELESDRNTKPMYKISSCRSRFVGSRNSHESMVLSTLDTGIWIQKAQASLPQSTFPLAVLLVRQEGGGRSDLLTELDHSHLVERVRGFSLEYHAVWETSKHCNISPPSWLPILSRDIRKLPPPAMKHTSSSAEGSPGAQSTTELSASTGSVQGVTDSTTTAVESTRHASIASPDELEAPPLKSFRNKRKRVYPEQQSAQPQQRYWSEYDHPEDGSDAGGEAYLLYINPDSHSTLDRFFDKIASFFTRPRRGFKHDPLLSSPTPKDDETSSDDEEQAAGPAAKNRAYGTFNAAARRSVSTAGNNTNRHARAAEAQTQRLQLHHVMATSLVAAIVILAVAFALAYLGKHKRAEQVHSAVFFAVAASVLFACFGMTALLRQRDFSWLLCTGAIAVLVVDVVGSGLLMAWILVG